MLNPDGGGRSRILHVEELSSGYGLVNVLSRVSLDVEQGEIVGVLGRNGAGKTTLLKTIMGIIPAKHGDVTLVGEGALSGRPPHAIALAGIGYVPQGRAIFPALSVLENLRVTQYAQARDDRRVGEVIDLFPSLKPLLRSLGGGLSGGQQQILALARALVAQPKLLLLDEPSEGIQPSTLDAIIDILSGLVTRASLSILLVEQNLDFAGALAHRAYVMDMGQIVRTLDRSDMSQSDRLARDLMGAG